MHAFSVLLVFESYSDCVAVKDFGGIVIDFSVGDVKSKYPRLVEALSFFCLILLGTRNYARRKNRRRLPVCLWHGQRGRILRKRLGAGVAALAVAGIA